MDEYIQIQPDNPMQMPLIDVPVAAERLCPRCRTMRPAAMFYKRRHSNVPKHCRHCERERSENSLRERRAIIRAAKLSGCADCGLSLPEHPEVFDFDHRPEADKAGPVSALVTRGTIEQLRAEIAKCDVVCANCHRIRTCRRKQYGNFGTDRAK